MKKNLLSLLIICLGFTSGLKAQEETEIYYPDFRYSNGKKGFLPEHVIGPTELVRDDNGGNTDLWKRVGDIPAESVLGYTREGDHKSLMVRGTDGTNHYITETWAVVTPVNLKAHASGNNLQVSFFTQARYGAGNISDFSVQLATDYTGDPATTTWTNVTSQLDQIDQNGSDAEFTKSTLNLNDWQEATELVLAFKYTCTANGVNDTESAIPTTWKVCEVRFTATAEELTQLSSCHFKDYSKFEFVNKTSTNGQKWKTVGATHPDDETEASSIQASAVYDDGGTKYVSPTETWTILKTVDCSGMEKAYLSFYNIAQYKKGGDSDLSIKVSTDYTPIEGDSVTAVENATWTDITDQFVLDQAMPYNDDWTFTKGSIDVDEANSNLTFAFVYSCSDTYEDVNGSNVNNRAGTWKIGDVNVEGKEVSFTTGNEEITEQSVSIYPNPATNVIYLNSTTGVQSAQIFDIHGKVLIEQEAANGADINIEALIPGIYFVRISDEKNNIETQRFIKQ